MTLKKRMFVVLSAIILCSCVYMHKAAYFEPNVIIDVDGGVQFCNIEGLLNEKYANITTIEIYELEVREVDAHGIRGEYQWKLESDQRAARFSAGHCIVYGKNIDGMKVVYGPRKLEDKRTYEFFVLNNSQIDIVSRFVYKIKGNKTQ